jgi:hypothetical protein
MSAVRRAIDTRTSSNRVSSSTAALIVNLPMLWSVDSASLLKGLLMFKPGMSSSRVLTPSFANSAAASALGASTTGYLQDQTQRHHNTFCHAHTNMLGRL